MPIIEKTDTGKLEQIRKLVSVANDTIDLPDATIASDVFLGEANLFIQGKVPGWAELTGDAQTQLQIITMKKAAVNLLAAFSRTTEERIEEVSESRIGLTPAEAIKRYESEIEIGIKILNPPNGADGGAYAVVVEVF